MASKKLLSRFDYLSTVSGGGYVGGWLAAWIKRDGDVLDVEKQLSTSRIDQSQASGLYESKAHGTKANRRGPIGDRIVDEEPGPVYHLRSYSNYLTPRPGLLSLDTWTVLTIYIRNSLINGLLLLPATMIPILLARLLILFFSSRVNSDLGLRQGTSWWTLFRTDLTVEPRAWEVFAAFVVSLFFSFFVMARQVYRLQAANAEGRAASAAATTVRSWDLWNVAPLVVGAILAFLVLPTWTAVAVCTFIGILAIAGRYLALISGFIFRHFGSPDPRRGISLGRFVSVIAMPFLVAVVLGVWIFGVVPRSNVSQPSLARSTEDFNLRLPKALTDFDPSSDESALRHVLPAAAYDWIKATESWKWNNPNGWAAGHFPWISALEFGLIFAGSAAITHLLAIVLSRTSGVTMTRGAVAGRWLSRDEAYLTFCAMLAGFSGGVFYLIMLSQIVWVLRDYPAVIVTVGPPLTILVFVVSLYIEVWLARDKLDDDVREWWARASAVLTLVAGAWLAFFAIVVYGPYLVRLANSPAVNWSVAASWLATVAGGVFAGRGGAANEAGASLPRRLLIAIAPPLFLVGLVVLVAMVIGLALDDSPVRSGVRGYWQGLSTTNPSTVLILLLLDVAAIAVVWFMTDVNVYSLNAMYANRLTRCYLGASRASGDSKGQRGAPTTSRAPARRANEFTGFDPDDDLALYDLRIGGVSSGGDPHSKEGATTYWGPHLLVNTSLNLVDGADLAWQDRKAESFVLSADFCGSKGTGYAETPPKPGESLKLGRAIAISGAAVDSNIGIHQSSALIALMTVFNARLGWWIKNPKVKKAWDASGPSAAYPLLWELLGQTNADRDYIHLSDGGHFENLGVYELVRRRCRYVVCVDAGTDRGASDDNLANMIRLVRTDFGVRIDLDTSSLRSEGADRLSRWHCAVGKIHYEDLDQGERPGVLVLQRTTMTGDEPPDVQEYAAKNPDFPLQTTLDQFFDESQFESYRALGEHVATSTFADALLEVGELWKEANCRDEFVRNNQRLFSAVQRRWSSVPTNFDSAFQAASAGWVELQKLLQANDSLTSLSRDIYPELEASPHLNGQDDGGVRIEPKHEEGHASDVKAGQAREELHTVAQMLQVMEDAWVGLRLRGYHDLPMYRGWLSVYRRWASADSVRRHWPTLRLEFSQGFVQFCENQLRLRSYSDAIQVTGNEPFVTSSIQRLDQAFAREWPGETFGPASLLSRVLNGTTTTDRVQPFLWLVVQSSSDPAKKLDPARQYACGVASLVADRSDLELFVWIEPAYRAMGIGGQCARKILADVRESAAAWAGTREVVVSYPGKSAGTDDDMEFDLWKNFFSRYDFQPRPTDSRIPTKADTVLFSRKFPGT